MNRLEEERDKIMNSENETTDKWIGHLAIFLIGVTSLTAEALESVKALLERIPTAGRQKQENAH